MPFNPLNPADTQGRAKDLFDGIKSKLGIVPNLYRVLGIRPAVLEANLKLNESLSSGNFDAATREAIALAVAGANTCDYCASAHSAISKNLKVDQAEITNRLNGRSDDPRINAIVKLAVAITDSRGRPGEAALQAARNAGLDDGDILETIANVTANIFTNYANHIADTEIDFPVVRTGTQAAA